MTTLVDLHGWHDARTDKPPLMEFVILCTQNTWRWNRTPLRTLYLGWYDKGDDDRFFWWADPGGEQRNVRWWHDLPEMPA